MGNNLSDRINGNGQPNVSFVARTLIVVFIVAAAITGITVGLGPVYVSGLNFSQALIFFLIAACIYIVVRRYEDKEES